MNNVKQKGDDVTHVGCKTFYLVPASYSDDLKKS